MCRGHLTTAFDVLRAVLMISLDSRCAPSGLLQWKGPERRQRVVVQGLTRHHHAGGHWVSVLGVLVGLTRPCLGVPLVARDTGQVLVAPPEYALVHRMPPKDFEPSAAYQWLDVVLEASGRDAERNRPRPTILSRTMALVLTSMYDAWTAYDDVAVGTRLSGQLRRPPRERTRANKEKAVAYAAYRSLLFVYPEDSAWIREQLRKKGFIPTMPPRTPRHRRAWAIPPPTR
jgi:hypothetical protein